MEKSAVQVYNGTVIQNFLVGAEECEGKIFFLKYKLAKTPAQFPDALFYTKSLEEAIIYAVCTAKDVQDEPIVLSGKTKHYPYIPGNKPFKIESVYILKDKLTTMNAIIDCIDSKNRRAGLVKLEDYFIEESPIEILRRLQGNR